MATLQHLGDTTIRFEEPSDSKRYLSMEITDGRLAVRSGGPIWLHTINTCDLIAWLQLRAEEQIKHDAGLE